MKITGYGRWYVVTYYDLGYKSCYELHFKKMPTFKQILSQRKNNSFYMYDVSLVDKCDPTDAITGAPKYKLIEMTYFEGPIYADPAQLNNPHYVGLALRSLKDYANSDVAHYIGFLQSYFGMSMQDLASHIDKLIGCSNAPKFNFNDLAIPPMQVVFSERGRTVKLERIEAQK